MSAGCAWAVVDVEVVDGSPADRDGRAELQSMMAGALAGAGLRGAQVLPGHPVGRLVLEFGHGDLLGRAVPDVVDELRRLLADRNRWAAADGTLLVTIALGTRSDDTAADVARLSDAPVVERVRSSSSASVPVVVLSEAAFGALPPETVGSHVRSGRDTFWVTVPGRSAPRGLRPEDLVTPGDGRAPASDGSAPRRSRSGNRILTVNTTTAGDIVGRDKITGDKFGGDKISGDKISGDKIVDPRNGRSGRWAEEGGA